MFDENVASNCEAASFLSNIRAEGGYVPFMRGWPSKTWDLVELCRLCQSRGDYRGHGNLGGDDVRQNSGLQIQVTWTDSRDHPDVRKPPNVLGGSKQSQTSMVALLDQYQVCWPETRDKNCVRTTVVSRTDFLHRTHDATVDQSWSSSLSFSRVRMVEHVPDGHIPESWMGTVSHKVSLWPINPASLP